MNEIIIAYAMQVCSEEAPYADLDIKVQLNNKLYSAVAQYHPEYKDNIPTGNRFLIVKVLEYK